MSKLKLEDVVVPIIKAIDLHNFLLKNHHRRTANIAYKIGSKMGLQDNDLSNLVLAASVHDIGALNISERNMLIQTDVENPYPHCIMGYEMLKTFKPFYEIAKIIKYHHIRYDDTLFEGEDIPIQSYILHLSDRIDILIEPDEFVLLQKSRVSTEITDRSNTVFHPDVVDAFLQVSGNDEFWLGIDNSMRDLFNKCKFDMEINHTVDTVKDFTLTLARIIDFRSEYTASHSYTVGLVAEYIGQLLGKDSNYTDKLKIAGFLHDIGKLGVDNSIIEKKGSLTEDEYQVIKSHSYYTNKILSEVEGFEDINFWAKHHHEKIDGSGYPFGLKVDQFDEGVKILAYADILSALTEDRPYRGPLTMNKAFEIIKNKFASIIDEHLYDVLIEHKDELKWIIDDSHQYAKNVYDVAMEHYSIYE